MPKAHRTAAAFLLYAAALPLAAAPEAGRPASRPPASEPVPTTFRFVDELTMLEEIGVSYLPIEGAVTVTTTGSNAAARIELPDRAGTIAVYHSQHPSRTIEDWRRDILAKFNVDKSSATRYSKETLDRLRERILIHDPERVIATDGRELRPFYVRTPPARTGDPDMVRGYTIANPFPGRFIIFELFTSADRHDRAIPMFEAIVGTARFADPTTELSRRRAAITAGQAALGRLSADDYRRIFGDFGARWQRCYKPSGTGSRLDDTEVGYRRITAEIGHLGDLQPRKPRDRWNQDERREGLIVRLDGRFIHEGTIVDTRAIYFLEFDLESETWVATTRIAPKEGRPEVAREEGFRRGTQMRVKVEAPHAPPGDITPTLPGGGRKDGFLSIAESILLPQLLIEAGVPLDAAFYIYDQSSGLVQLREVSLSRPLGADAGWQVSQRSASAPAPSVGVYTGEGRLVRLEDAGGNRWEPIEYEALLRLWKDKGLPTD